MFENDSEGKNFLKSYVISFAWCNFSIEAEISTIFEVMFLNVSEDKYELKSYVISPTWCIFHTKSKFQPFFKSCSRMSQKRKIDIKVR